MKVKVIRWTQEELVGVRNCQGWFQGYAGFKGKKEASKGREERSF